MRYKLPFSEVSSIVELNSTAIGLPDNIVFAPGDTHEERRNNAVGILLDRPEVNTVVMLEAQRKGIDKVIKQLETGAQGTRIRSTHDLSEGGEPSGAYQNLKDYLERRNVGMKNPLIDQDLIAVAGKTATLWHQSMQDADSIENTYLSKSIVAFFPDYIGHRTREDAHINAHIDAAKSTYDLRIVECMNGSGTVLFNDEDFNYYGGDGKALRNTDITCWTLAEGSSVIFRTPSIVHDRMGARPAAHAHGIGEPDDTPESRLTMRHDLVLE